MKQRHLIVIDEQSQKARLNRLKENLKNDGIELVYTEINPVECTTRKNGDLVFDIEILKSKIQEIPYLTHLDVFATDYNLIDETLKGIDVVKVLYDCLPYYRKRVVMYSAQIEDVITNIVTKQNGFEEQVEMLKTLSKNEIRFLSSEGEFENKIKNLIINEPDSSIDARLSDSLVAISNERFTCNLPGYTDRKICEIGNMLREKGSSDLKKEIVDQIVAYITTIKGYE